MQAQKLNSVWATDIHMDFLSDEYDENVLDEYIQEFAQKVLKLNPKLLILTGDIDLAKPIEEYGNLGVAATVKKIQELIDCPVYFVLGNHDFYYGSFEQVRAECRALTLEKDHCLYLHQRDECIELDEKTALIGADGWYDGREGDLLNSNMMLNDFKLIDDLKDEDNIWTVQMQERLTNIAMESVQYIEKMLPQTFQKYQKVILATHVPPFLEASYHEGKPASPHSAPFFVSKILGEKLIEIMKNYPDKELLVLCGHSHSEAKYSPEEINNLLVIAGAAEYGKPIPQGIV